MITPFMLHLATWAVEFSFFAAILFMVLYTLLANWWKSAIGWARISLDFGIALALSPTMLHVLFNLRIEDSYPFLWYQIGAVAFVGCISLWNAYLVTRIQVGHWWDFRRRESDRHVRNGSARFWPRAKGNEDEDR